MLRNLENKPLRETDFTKYQDYERMANDPNMHEEFLQTDASGFAKYLKAEDVKHMIKKQEEIRTGKFDSIAGQGYLNQEKYINKKLEEMKIDSRRRMRGKYTGDYAKNKMTSINYKEKDEKRGQQQGRIKRCVWTINTRPFKKAHFATYPEKLCEIPIKAGCPEGGIVLDPFFGSGTTGIVALEQNKHFGSVLPKFTGGFYNTLSYKGITLSAAIDFQKGGKFFSLSEQWGNSGGLLDATAAINDRGFNVRDA